MPPSVVSLHGSSGRFLPLTPGRDIRDELAILHGENQLGNPTVPLDSAPLIFREPAELANSANSGDPKHVPEPVAAIVNSALSSVSGRLPTRGGSWRRPAWQARVQTCQFGVRTASTAPASRKGETMAGPAVGLGAEERPSPAGPLRAIR